MVKRTKRRTFDSNFREQAVSLVLESSLTQSQVSKELGISQSLLSRWVREHRRQQAEAEQVERSELLNLHGEVAALKEEVAF